MVSRSITQRVYVEGLADFRRDLEVLPVVWKEAEKEFSALAAKSIVEGAQAKAQNYSSAKGKLYEKILADIKLKGVAATYGGKPYSKGAEFGAYRYHQFLPWRGKGNDAGYFFYPAVRVFAAGPMLAEYKRVVMSVVERKFSH